MTGRLHDAWILTLTTCLLLTCESVSGQLSIRSALSKRLIDPQLPLQEIQTYLEARIQPIPEVNSVAQWENYAQRLRTDILDQVVFRGAAQEWRQLPTHVEWLETIYGGPGYHIRKLRYEAVPGLWVAALLYEPEELSGNVPVILNFNGHDRDAGKAANYNQLRCINQVKRGMIALNVEWLGMGQLNTPGFEHYKMNQLNLCGTSGLAPFYLSMSRALDILLQHKNADPKRVAVAGLSGGGWQTIVISALDERVTFCNPVAGYSSFQTRVRFPSDLGDSEQTPCDLASIADYTHLTALLAPRPALLTKNAEDNCCFKAAHALPPLLQAAKPIYSLYDQPDHLRSHVNDDPGTHNFGLDNRQQLYAAIADYFYDGDETFPRHEIASDDELKTAEQLNVDLPTDNMDFNRLAGHLSTRLKRSLPTDGNLEAWQSSHRPLLAKTVRLQEYQTISVEQSTEHTAIGSARWQRLRIGGHWTVPAVEIRTPQADPDVLAIVISDEGRMASELDSAILLSATDPVLCCDLFYFGESEIAQRDFLYATLLSSVGDRPLGIQVSQILSIARRAKEQQGVKRVKLIADGPRTSLIALVAAALSEREIDLVETYQCRGSLQELIDQNLGMNQVPESMCFGLYKHFDIEQLAALAAPRPVLFHDSGRRIREHVRPILEKLGR